MKNIEITVLKHGEIASLVEGHASRMVELKKEKEHELGQLAELTPLGRKLLGLDFWEQESKGESEENFKVRSWRKYIELRDSKI